MAVDKSSPNTRHAQVRLEVQEEGGEEDMDKQKLIPTQKVILHLKGIKILCFSGTEICSTRLKSRYRSISA